MRILHVLDHSLPLLSGYTFRTRAIVTAQMARGLEVACLTGVRQGAVGADPETIENIPFYRTPSPASAPSPLREWREIKALEKRLDALVEAWRPDQLHVHSPVLNALAALPVARRHAIPLIYEIRAFWEDAAVGTGTGSDGSLRRSRRRDLRLAPPGPGRSRHLGRQDHRRPERRRHEPVRQPARARSQSGAPARPPGCRRGRLYRLVLRLRGAGRSDRGDAAAAREKTEGASAAGRRR